MTDHTDLIRAMYDGFNARDIDAVLAVLADDVMWANGVEGGHEHGREAVRAYWTRQWETIDPRVEPIAIARRGDGAIAVEVHQRVQDTAGALLLDERVRHVFRVAEGRVTRFDVENAGGLSGLAHPTR